MTERKRPDASVILLADILLAILLFAVCSSVSFLVFAKANEMTETSREKTYAVNETDSLSELLYASASQADFLQLLKTYYPDALIQDDTVTITYDDDFNPDAREGTYTMTIALHEEDHLLRADMTMKKDSDEIYQESTSAVLSGASE